MKYIPPIVGVFIIFLFATSGALFFTSAGITMLGQVPTVQIHSYPIGEHTRINIHNIGGGPDYAPLEIEVYMEKRTFLDVYENGKKIIHVEKTTHPLIAGSLFNTYVIDTKGQEVLVPLGSITNYEERTRDDIWHLRTDENWFSSNADSTDLKARILLGGIGTANLNKKTTIDPDGVAIDLEKYPLISKTFGWTPYGIQTIIPWNVTLKTDDIEENVNKEIIVQHQKIYLTPAK